MAITCNPNCWVIGFDKRGMIRGEFIISTDGDLWGMCKFIDGKVKERNKGAFLYSVRQIRYVYDIHYVKVVLKYVYKGYSTSVNIRASRLLGREDNEIGRPQECGDSPCGPQQVEERFGQIPVASESNQER